MSAAIDEAVKRVEAKEESAKQAEPHRSVTLTIASTGRHAVISTPVDMTPAELFEVVAWMSEKLRLQLIHEEAQRAASRSPLVVPTSKILLPT